MKSKMYVRCPADYEDELHPRIFVCAQILAVDDFAETVTVKIHDPSGYLEYFDELPSDIQVYPKSQVNRCTFFNNSEVFVGKKAYDVICKKKEKDEEGYYYYYLQNKSDKSISCVCEKDIIAGFNNGRVSPRRQLLNYEFQNPVWYVGRYAVSKNVNILHNAMYGFDELAGSKIYLLPHQVNTIMRCLQDEKCRYMLADEVGMGKTIEAISILKVYMKDRSRLKILIVVPKQLKEQWHAELLLKFSISIGVNKNNNRVSLISYDQLTEARINRQYDFVVMDEIHQEIASPGHYSLVHQLSHNTKNLLLLSATPVQQKRTEYLNLLRVLDPEKYDHVGKSQFEDLAVKQMEIVERTSLLLDDILDLEEIKEEVLEEGGDPLESDECLETFDDILDEINEFIGMFNDDHLNTIVDHIDKEYDFGIAQMKLLVSYVADNYQIESHVIRNRRKTLQIIAEEEGEPSILPTRKLHALPYNLDLDHNYEEKVAYNELIQWANNRVKTSDSIFLDVLPVVGAFFSSAAAYQGSVWTYNVEIHQEHLNKWIEYEQKTVNMIKEIIQDPDEYKDYYESRLVKIINYLYEECSDSKVVLFTNYKETLNLYKKALLNVFDQSEITYFYKGIDPEILEVNVYHFQTDSHCNIMLCDQTGGEGRNFQCADFVIHIDLPWDANQIEQRIGRLDRLERDPERSVVTSVVPYALDSFEESLFQFWNNGLEIFTHSLSGMEIIMNDINTKLVHSIEEDFETGLASQIDSIIKDVKRMTNQVNKEQNFDSASTAYAPLFNNIREQIENYNENDSKMFREAMTSWSSLAGFHAQECGEDIIKYTDHAFSVRSAFKAMLIPPNWSDYFLNEHNAFLRKVQQNASSIRTNERAIKGTFNRKIAIENDYIHFFAPGDAIYDCIVSNAINSCKGTCSAIEIKGKYNWAGFRFIYRILPNYEYLLENHVSLHEFDLFKSYVNMSPIDHVVSLINKDQIDDIDIRIELNSILTLKNIKSHYTINYGRRSSGDKSKTLSNIDWFIHTFGKNWANVVKTLTKQSKEFTYEKYMKQANLSEVKKEMERIRRGKIAKNNFYDLDDQDSMDLESVFDIILKALETPQIELESALFVRMEQ
ncbi:hypothetical protein SG0102_12080 [Intestinibaculum porci]|uniref:RNA polymerase-associated protein RapA n=1 Tax=Intestinibaculum porci TaxID=2487118 RepID=A0A3G9JTP1_9FIRM|nr:SNF2-related protein [Intestinibaculum porci]BBH26274.1 hypothetical protein SG0102_12080 [Intestinibaculum porci]